MEHGTAQGFDVEADVKRIEVSAVVIRADGTKEDQGVISYHHRNPAWRLWWKLTGRAH